MFMRAKQVAKLSGNYNVTNFELYNCRRLMNFQVQPSWNYLDEFVTDAIHESFAVDSLKSSHPIHVPVQQTEQIRQIFDPISYKKGASVIRMLNNVLGENTFKMGLINYLNAKKYSNSYHDYLWEELTKQAHKDGTLDKSLTLKQIMDSWILQTGFPVINVTRDYETNSATITQVTVHSILAIKCAMFLGTICIPNSFFFRNRNCFN